MPKVNKIRVGIVGGAGYTAGELIRILLYHPAAELKYIQSGSNSGKHVSAVHTDLLGDTDQLFEDVNFTIPPGAVVGVIGGNGFSLEVGKLNK